jgi:hypothetical protein
VKLAEETEIITTANTVHARNMLDSHRFGREKELGEGKGTLIFYSTDLVKLKRIKVLM